MYLSGVELIFRTITTLVKLLRLNYTKCSIHNFLKNHLPSYSIYLYIVLNDGITTQSIVFKVKFLVQEESFEKKSCLTSHQ